ncbi:MAG: hypothetical protein Q8N58_00725 [bacterium]|nr:hypothetical protein [bacterium]
MRKMKNNGTNHNYIIIILVITAVLASFFLQKGEHTESCEFPSVLPNVLIADEFERSPLYSMYWVNELAWIKEILLVKAERVHKEFGYAPCFAKALIEIKKKYTITAKIPISTRWDTYASPTDALLLEVEPKQTEQKQ